MYILIKTWARRAVEPQLAISTGVVAHLMTLLASYIHSAFVHQHTSSAAAVTRTMRQGSRVKSRASPRQRSTRSYKKIFILTQTGSNKNS
ncbi:hypothetical protein E2C01_061482 [Portunus trituberculatus]|uniref:Uncharacterized protein n=1 Tax=Portunus trituberculatus TaxID=210409 RepID=A0A5B7HBR9_PORTR|nr:hypothetical protein [Portunus trituberculatus]